ncbi:type I-Fv CRISPR-associated protein Cas5fv [uncultured Desulfuromusa sp.]|uniref:type I-Fv CRISPR-associated protein Cas5fv n=1 Tax=uncultured Desulfuromusa sp. TaxID=219183 RepID=UPI002AA664AB|nr:type I-Fv CRISPR-associated protein Cas5fv [uncultured Desulfuromusa sp.]
MKILIEYESSWRNSFLEDPDGNNKPLPKKGRKFIGSLTNINKADGEFFIKREVSKDTVMGVLSRLVGDQRKLYQARDGKYGPYYFKEIESQISFSDKPEITNEINYVRNMTGNTDQNSYIGSINTNHPLFTSGFSNDLWMILNLTLKDLISFVLKKPFNKAKASLSPKEIVDQVKSYKDIQLDKLGEQEDVLSEQVENVCSFFKRNETANVNLRTNFPSLQKGFADIEYVKNGKLVTRAIYCSALYLQAIYLAKIHNMDGILLKGFSVNGFTPKDFMKSFAGGQKLIYGNPYMRETMVKGEGKIVLTMTKASGKLEININVDRDKAKEIKRLIENAGVSSFYLGKKGLAYVTDIDTREVQH